MKLCALTLSLILFLSSCWDYREANMLDYVFGMGIDVDGGRYNVSLEILNPKNGKGTVVKAEGSSLKNALDVASTCAGKSLYLGQLRLVVLGESARVNFEEIVSALVTERRIYQNVALCVSKNAQAVITSKTPNGNMVSEHVSDILANPQTGKFFTPIELWQVSGEADKRGFTELPIISISENGISQVSGMVALFAQSKTQKKV